MTGISNYCTEKNVQLCTKLFSTFFQKSADLIIVINTKNWIKFIFLIVSSTETPLLIMNWELTNQFKIISMYIIIIS